MTDRFLLWACVLCLVFWAIEGTLRLTVGLPPLSHPYVWGFLDGYCVLTSMQIIARHLATGRSREIGG